uniref:G-protein coupled receptors family 1 profile domain-containing protein n=1 Tax=Monopterus albus TaxID=43700 RepID=A0A3Q3J9E7_MONAL
SCTNPYFYINNDNCTDVDILMKRYYLPVAYAMIFTVGLVGNLTCITVYLTKLHPWKSSSIIMVNLALADLLYILTLFHFQLYGSILFLTCLAVFRYVVVMHPLRAAQVQQKMWGIVACSAVWIIAAAKITPMLTMLSLEKRSNVTYCLDFASIPCVDDIRWYCWLLTALGFLLPLMVVFMCYIGIIKHLVKRPRSTGPCRVRARRMTVVILVVFVICFLPYNILRVLRIETRKFQEMSCMIYHIVHAAYIISRPLAGINTFFNLALFGLSWAETLYQPLKCTCNTKDSFKGSNFVYLSFDIFTYFPVRND